MSENTDWQPGASNPVLQKRARMLQTLRAFFAMRDVLEVETPVLSRAAVTDVHIDSFSSTHQQQQFYLHTSPEFAMKRLLAAGSGDIYQVCKVFRAGEAGTKHNPEFSMLEWYRLGFDHHRLMDEVDELIRELLDSAFPLKAALKLTYQDAMKRFAGIDVDTAGIEELKQSMQGLDISGMDDACKDSWLDLIMTHRVETALPENTPVFIYDYPASQAALAKIRYEDNPVAERFEFYINGMELANGFHELTDAGEQRQRFMDDLQSRWQHQREQVPVDERFLAALEQGLPECAGVALGLDRVLMLAAGKKSIKDILSFDIEHS